VKSDSLRRVLAYVAPLGTELGSYDKAAIRHLFLSESELGRKVQTLDIGFGNGYFTQHAASQGMATGITLHPHELKSAEARYGRKFTREQLSFEVSSLQEMRATRKFDQVLALDVIEHIRDDRLALKTIRALMNDGGRLVVTVPNRDFEFSSRPHIWQHETGWHVRHGYTFDALESLLSQTGFEPVDRRRFGNWLTGEILRGQTRFRIGTVGRALTTAIGLPLTLLPQFGRPHTIGVVARAV
jgi:cyclopropane fatty-acyl-phospholipid synthase-like methyltransferase